MIFQFCSDVGRRPTRFLLRLFACCRSMSDPFPHVVRTLLFLFLHVFSFNIVGQLQVIHQPPCRPKEISAGEHAVDRKIGLERVNILTLALLSSFGRVSDWMDDDDSILITSRSRSSPPPNPASTTCIPSMGPTYRPPHWVLWLFSLRWTGRSLKFTTFNVPWLGMLGIVPPRPQDLVH
jgi:hypothetical protein